MEIMSPKKKKTKTTTMTSTSSYVPNDIMIDILSWVPANSLLRLRWTCKYWLHLITRDDDFIMKQCHRSTTTIYPHKPSLLISKPSYPHLKNPSTSYPCKIFQCYIDYSTISCGAMNPILSGIFVDFHILGSCHGLILFSYYFQERNETILCIWNPFTKEYKYLPEPKPFYSSFYGFNSETFGLGYDHSIQDYKVTHNVNFFDGSIYHVNIYTLRTNSWTYGVFMNGAIETNIPSKCFGHGVFMNGAIETNIPRKCFGHGVFMNGALYFIHKHCGLAGSGARIFSLDFEKKTYREISNQPDCLNYYDKDKFIKGLAMFEGCLCLTMYTLTYDKIDDNDIIETWRMLKRFEMWVMKKDYNNQEYSWSKLCEIPGRAGLLHDFLQPLRFTKEGEILLLDKTKGLVLFDPKNNKLHPIKQATTTVDPHKIEAIYIESLVSLNSSTYIDGRGHYMYYWKDEYDIDEERDYMPYY